MVSIIRFSLENKMRPTAVLYRKPDPFSGWSDLDYKLVQAYQTIKDETCSKCGNPVWLCRSTDSNIDWSIDTSVCYATRAIEARRFRDDNDTKKQPTATEKAKWGADYFATPRPIVPGAELPTRSQALES